MRTTANILSAGRARWSLVLSPLSFCFLSGCLGLPAWHPFKAADPPPPGPADSLVLRGDKLEADTGVVAKKGKTADNMDGGKELLRRGEYAKAESVFHAIAEDTKNSPQIAEEARYYEAEALRLQGKYPKAADTYSRLLKDFITTSTYRDQASQRLFDIANYWLDDTRSEMEESQQKKDGKRWFVLPVGYVHFDKSKPLLDEEGWAVEKLEEIKLDIRGPLADKALFYLGSVKFYRKDYHEADQHFSQLVEMLPESPLAPQALKMAIICKQLSTGGSDYDGRKTAEARQLVHTAFASYPQLADKERTFLTRQLVSISQQQADKDFKIAEFYKRTGHPASAYFYYEIVRRRYPGTDYYKKATERKAEIEAEMAKHPQKKEFSLGLPSLPSLPSLWPFGKKDPTAGPVTPQVPPTPNDLRPGAPLTYPETAPAPRTLPPEMMGAR